MITLVKSSSFKCVERINDSTENLLTTYSETNTALQKGEKCSMEVVNADFQMDVHTFSLIRTWIGRRSRHSCLQNPICSQRLTSDTPLYISSSFLFFSPLLSSWPSICHEWLKMTYSLIFLRKQRAQPAAQQLWVGQGKQDVLPALNLFSALPWG